MKTRMVGAVALGLLAAACGTNPQDRVAGGAAAGAATGAGVGALGGPVGALAGAGIGAAAGATTGAVTSPDQVNLGRPVWNDPEVRVPGTDGNRSTASRGGSSGMGSSETRQLQQALRDRGFDPGPVDGINGPRTRQAVMDFQRQNNMQATGRADTQMLSSLGISGGGTASGSRSAGRNVAERDRAYMGGGMVVDGQNTGTGSAGSTMGTGSGGMGTNMGTGRGMGTTNQMGTTGPMGNTGVTSGTPRGNLDAQGGPGTGSNRGVGGTLGGGAGTTRGTGSTSASPDNPGSGSNSAGSSSQ